MDKYIKQLIQDMQTIYRRNREIKRFGNDRETLAEVGRVLAKEPAVTFAEVMGIDPAVFPAREKLNEEQAEKLARHILILWKYYFIEPVYPESFPLSRLYPLLVAKFTEKITYLGCISGSVTHVEFCHYDLVTCPFGRQYCQTCWDNGPLLAE